MAEAWFAVYALISKSSCISREQTLQVLGLRINQHEWRYIPDGSAAEQAARWTSEALVRRCHKDTLSVKELT